MSIKPDASATSTAISEDVGQTNRWIGRVGSIVGLETDDGTLHEDTTILGPARSGRMSEMRVEYSDGTVGDCDSA